MYLFHIMINKKYLLRYAMAANFYFRTKISLPVILTSLFSILFHINRTVEFSDNYRWSVFFHGRFHNSFVKQKYSNNEDKYLRMISRQVYTRRMLTNNEDKYLLWGTLKQRISYHILYSRGFLRYLRCCRNNVSVGFINL